MPYFCPNEPQKRSLSALWLLLILATSNATASSKAELEAVRVETLHPYTGEKVAGVDTTHLTGKVMAGYQGWFNADGDGAGRGNHRWTKDSGPLIPGNAKFDLWPDVSELTEDEMFDTGLRRADGLALSVFSSYRKATVLRHFQWMKDYGIDGAFVQRFIAPLRDAATLRHNNAVLTHCREGANRAGRTYAVMYDLSGLGEGSMQEVMDDWRGLRSRMKVTSDSAYLQHRGRPVVAVWGVGFNKNRAYTIAECHDLVKFLKSDGCTVMLGVPTGWRELNRDCLPDPVLHEVLKLADIVSPWTVGRYKTPVQSALHGAQVWTPDLLWCRNHGLDYLPVVFPGFSWHNMKGRAFDKAPRLKGEFLWAQFTAAKKSGASMAYVAMFDEVDEGTAIFKCTNNIPSPAGSEKFLTYEGMPSDFYLKLTGDGGRLLRGEINDR